MNGLRGLKALTSAYLTGNAQYFSLPTIGGLYSSKNTILSRTKGSLVVQVLDMFKAGIPIYSDVYEESGGNDISEQVLIGGIGNDSAVGAMPGDDVAGALVKVADNIVVNPRKWRIHGYTGFNVNTKVGHIINGLVPEVTMQNFINKFGRDSLNSTLKQVLQFISEARRPFKFNTREGETIPCLIKSYNVRTVAENSNFVELDLEIQEFRFLSLSGDELGKQVVVGGVNTPFTLTKLGRASLKTISI